MQIKYRECLSGLGVRKKVLSKTKCNNHKRKDYIKIKILFSSKDSKKNKRKWKHKPHTGSREWYNYFEK